MKKLKPKDKKFVNEFVKNGGNGTKAMVVARPNITKESARREASRLLTNVHIRRAIDNLIEEQEGGKDSDIVLRMIKRAKDDTNPAVATKNDELLLKLKGKFKDKSGFTMNEFLKKLE